MIMGGYGKGGETMPRVITVTIARTARRLPKAGAPQPFLVRLHEEGTCLTWQHDVTVTPDREAALLADQARLDAWATAGGADVEGTLRAVTRLGRALFDTFLGDDGSDYLAEHPPTALMIDADETILHLPWELLHDGTEHLALTVPFGRIAATRARPRKERDANHDDRRLHVLALTDPTGDVAFVEAELAPLRQLAGQGWVELEELAGAHATLANFRDTVRDGHVELLHIAGHGGFAEHDAGRTGLALADGPVTTEDLLGLPWEQPPYFVYTSACWSGRSSRGRRLIRSRGRSSGVAAAFLAAGTSGVAGFSWPVSQRSAAELAAVFYNELLNQGSVGEAFRIARRATVDAHAEQGDLGGHAAVLYGDAATGRRRDLAMAT